MEKMLSSPYWYYLNHLCAIVVVTALTFIWKGHLAVTDVIAIVIITMTFVRAR